jgi:hypothetical protein
VTLAAAVVLEVDGPAGGAWSVVREDGVWRLYAGAADDVAARVTLSQEDAWRMYTRVVPPEPLERRATLEGDLALGRRLLRSKGIIA